MVQLVQVVRFVSPFTSLGKVGRLSAKNDSAEWFLEDTLEQIAWEDLGVERGGLRLPLSFEILYYFYRKIKII